MDYIESVLTKEKIMKEYIYHLLNQNGSGKTLCGREVGRKYNIIDPSFVHDLRVGQRMCKRCLKRAIDNGLVPHPDDIPPEGFDRSDRDTNDWLTRLGIGV